jgi:glycosyltransferase involved in cell wall biosynthesis
MTGGRPGVLYILSHEFGDPRSAATSRYRALVGAARAAGWKVAILTGSGVRDPDAPFAATMGPRDNALAPLRRALGELWIGARAAWKAPSDGFVLVGIPPYFTALVVATVLRLRGRRYGVDMRDIYPDVLAASGMLRPASLAFRLLERWTGWVLRGAWQLVGATQEIATRMRGRTGAGYPVTFVRNGFAECFTPAPAPETPPLIVSHGTFGRFQDSALLAEVILAARHLGRPWRFLVVGEGPSAHELDRAGGEGFTRIRALPQEELGRMIAGAAVGISLRGRDEISAGAIPVRILEYLGAGVPVLVHPRSEAGAEVTQHGLGVELDGKDADEIVAALDAMLAPEAQARFRANILARRGVYSAQRQWEPFLEALVP